MGSKTFFDTNVLVYLYDVHEPKKSRSAKSALAATAPSDLVLSTQVLQEFYWIVTRKLDPPLSPAAAALQITELARHSVVNIDVPLILRAVARATSDCIAFWDGLIVEAALRAGCAMLFTEDLQDGRDFDGLRVMNPFVS